MSLVPNSIDFDSGLVLVEVAGDGRRPHDLGRLVPRQGHRSPVPSAMLPNSNNMNNKKKKKKKKNNMTFKKNSNNCYYCYPHHHHHHHHHQYFAQCVLTHLRADLLVAQTWAQIGCQNPGNAVVTLRVAENSFDQFPLAKLWSHESHVRPF